MNSAPRAASPSWHLLRRNLGGSFTARAQGLLAAEFVLLNPKGEEFGRLRLRGVSAAELRFGSSLHTFEASGSHYRMVADGQELLAATPKGRSIDVLEIVCGGRTYEARIKFFRNLAIASYPGDERTVTLSGGSMGRSYEALFAAEDGCALPVAIFLLWHVVANRRRAYLLGSPRRGRTV